MHSEEFIGQLIKDMENLGYFKFSNPKDLAEIKEDLWFGFKIGEFNPTLDEEFFSIGKEKRYFMIDHVSVTDKDFVPYLLEEIEPTLEHLNIDIEDFTLPNSKNYPIKLCFAIDKINEVLADKNADGEQFYLMNKDDELAIILLTSAQQLVFETHFTDKNETPYTTKDWLAFHFNK
jgi:hypothetical protein